MKKVALFFVIFLFIGCQSKDPYEKLRPLLSSIGENSNVGQIENVIIKIDSFTIAYPEHRLVDSLLVVKSNYALIIEHKMFEKFYSKITNIFDYNYTSYEDATSKFGEAISFCYEMKQKLKNEELVTKIDALNQRLEKSINSIKTEVNDYNYLISNLTMDNLNSFLSQYPNSVMRSTLETKKDEIYLNEYLQNARNYFNTISQLNSEVSKLNSCISNLSSLDNKLKMKDILRKIEEQRRNVLEAELSDNLSSLLSIMENRARSKASGAHFNARVETCSPRGSNPEIVGYRSTFERQYLVYTKSGTWLTGFVKRELRITVNGEIEGDLQTGVSYRVTGVRVDNDKRLN